MRFDAQNLISMTFSNIQWEPHSKREARRQEVFTFVEQWQRGGETQRSWCCRLPLKRDSTKREGLGKGATFMRDEEESIHTEANRSNSEGIRWRQISCRSLSRSWNQSADALQLAKEIRRHEWGRAQALERSRSRE